LGRSWTERKGDEKTEPRLQGAGMNFRLMDWTTSWAVGREAAVALG
jgi:hypothetical protein